MRVYLFFFFLFLSSDIIAQCFSANRVFGDGEEISYTVSYNWGPVWVDAGRVTFCAVSEQYKGKQVWHLKSTGTTFKSYELLFKVRDYYDTRIDPGTFKTYEFRRYIYEGGYTLLNTLIFDHGREMVYSSTKTNNNPVRIDTLKLTPCLFDMLTAVYYVRTLDLANMKPDLRIPVNVLIDDSVYQIQIRAVGKEIVEHPNGMRYRCIRFVANMVKGTIFKGDEDVSVWVTDDQNKVPVYIEAKILIGSIKAYLKGTKGLLHPATSLIKKSQ